MIGIDLDKALANIKAHFDKSTEPYKIAFIVPYKHLAIAAILMNILDEQVIFQRLLAGLAYKIKEAVKKDIVITDVKFLPPPKIFDEKEFFTIVMVIALRGEECA